MAAIMSVKLDLTQGATLGDLRVFLQQADHIGAADDQDVLTHDDNGDLTDLEAFGPGPGK